MAMIVAFAHEAWSSERETFSEARKAVREVKRSAMSGAQSAPPLKTDRGFTARMKATRICEYGGTGTLKLEEV
jgi:hypothetical protein